MSKIPPLTYHAITTLITEGNADDLRILLEQRDVDINEGDENGQTFLMYAAQIGHLNIVEELLLQGANVDAEDEDNWTALLYAAKEGHTDIIIKLIENGVKLDHRDMGGWTALMWACYKGYIELASLLLQRGSSANVYDKNHISCLVWASGRGHLEIVRNLLAHGAKVNAGDKYGTTPLVWASRKGYLDIVDELLRAGSNVDTAGMYSWTSLIVATKGGFSDVVEVLLEYKPNVNAVDMSGGTALTLACKEGYIEIAMSLLNSGAYINLQDRNGDTNLIHATKAGYFNIVDALLKKYADVDIQGSDGKTALYWAVEKGFVDIVKLILNANPNTEIPAKGGDTPLMKATRSRNVEIVQLLIDKKAKVSSVDKKGDTALHIAMRAQSKAIVEILLRNPKNSQLLYRPNRAGETPYNIDTNQHRSILAQIFGARRLNTNEDNENLLGYDLYGCALADILSEPTLSMPICVGLYAKWGSGKSFLLNKLEDEMRNFTFQRLEPTFEFSWLVNLLLLLLSSTVGFILAFATGIWIVGLSVGSGILFMSYVFFAIITFGNKLHDWEWSFNASVYFAEHLLAIKTMLQVIFCNPPASRRDAHLSPVRFLFTEQTKVSSSGEDVSVAQIITTLYSAIEDEYGFFTTRFYRVFKPRMVSGSNWKYRRLCCIPNVFVALFVVVAIYICCILLLVSGIQQDFKIYKIRNSTENEYPNYYLMKPSVIALGCIVGAVILTNIHTWYRMILTLLVSNYRRVKLVTSHTSSYLEKLKNEVETMTLMVQCMDAFVGQQTRLVVVVDGLDSCEQEKVLKVLDAVHLLFSDPNLPFVTILAIDPHVIIKAIEANIHHIFHNSSIRGHDYLRNIVHLPFYLQNSGLRKVKVAQKAALQTCKHTNMWIEEKEEKGHGSIVSIQQTNRRTSASSVSIPDIFRKSRKSAHKLKNSDSIGSSICNVHHNVTGAHDLTKVLLTDDYFSDINPRSMRRLLNIVYITGRLLKAFNIDFNWYHLAVWVNTTERWPYRISWIITYYEIHENELDDPLSLKTIFEKIKVHIPTSKEEEPMLDLDHDERKFDVFLSIHSSTLQVIDLKIFLPFTINLDPYIRKSIHEDQHHLTALIKGTTTHGDNTLPVVSYGGQNRWGRFSPPRPPSSHTWASPQSYLWRSEPRQDSGHGTLSPGPTVWWDYPVENANFRQCPKQVTLPNQQKLSTLSLEGVINVISSLENINKNKLSEYSKVVTQNNINGLVLLTCDLNELKDVLKMSFGDWELFRVAILSLRDQEYQVVTVSEGDRSRSSSVRDKTRQTNTDTTQEKPKSSNNVSENNERAEGRSRRPNNALEKQITLEESLIFGALETLNEEAQEDALEEKLERQENLNESYTPVLSVSEDHLSDTDSNSTIGSVVISPTEVDVLYIPRDSPSLRVRATSLPDAVPDIEQGSATESIFVSSSEISTSHSLPNAGEFKHVNSALSVPSPSKYMIKALSHEDDLKRAVLTASMERLSKRRGRLPSSTSDVPSSPMSEKSARQCKTSHIASSQPKVFDSDSSDSSSNNSQEKLLGSDKREETQKLQSISAGENTEGFYLDDEHTPLVSPTHSVKLDFQTQVYNSNQIIESSTSPQTPVVDEHRRIHRQFSIDIPSEGISDQTPILNSNTMQQSASNITFYPSNVQSQNCNQVLLFAKSPSSSFPTSPQQMNISSTESLSEILDETIL
ncbi:kinase D-interacting substrate of 220 kDa B isoform X2 [Centruroides vittatus]|uniref:kinase D-interacting substrate of 220 kDa B isoform X2 n=1 Tax=Centruroides vittatus TaxID=120091 RepID=UPI003510CD4B